MAPTREFPFTHSALIGDVNDDGKLSGILAVVDEDNASNLDEASECGHLRYPRGQPGVQRTQATF
jgi:hypothetical protein